MMIMKPSIWVDNGKTIILSTNIFITIHLIHLLPAHHHQFTTGGVSAILCHSLPSMTTNQGEPHWSNDGTKKLSCSVHQLRLWLLGLAEDGLEALRHRTIHLRDRGALETQRPGDPWRRTAIRVVLNDGEWRVMVDDGG